MKTVIHENERGLLFENGRYVKMLSPGKYRTFGSRKTIEVVSTEHKLESDFCPLEVLLRDSQVAAQTVTVEATNEEVLLHFVNGQFYEILPAGKYAFWNENARHEFQIVKISQPEVSEEVPRYIFSRIPSSYFTRLEVGEHQKARLYYDQKFVKLLDTGVYFFWKNSVRVSADFIETRLQQMTITGQEILSRDKVALRISVVCTYRVTDYIRAFTGTEDYQEYVHVMIQMALREYVGKHTLDEILEGREEMSQLVLAKLKENAGSMYVEFTQAGVRDIILPGEIRQIMNMVLMAEKKAQANVIARREEVASTRSLLNTAKMMDENKTLYRLKELEYLERICEKVDSIRVSGSGDLLAQLAALVRGNS